MEMKRLHYLEFGRCEGVSNRFWPLLCLLVLGCGSGSETGVREVKPPPNVPGLANDRYERVQVAIDGKPIDAGTTITVGRDFVVTVSFRRLHVWPEMNNPESMIEAFVMEKIREHTVTRRYPTLVWQSEKAGVLTFAGKVEALQESGVFGLWIKETVITERTETGELGRYYLFTKNIRNVKS